MASSARLIDNTICKDGSKFSGVLQNPTLTEKQASDLQTYLKESSKLVNLKNQLEGSKIGKKEEGLDFNYYDLQYIDKEDDLQSVNEEESLNYTNNTQQDLDVEFKKLQEFILNHNLQSVIDDYLLKEYLSPLNNELQRHFQHLYDKVLNFFIENKLTPKVPQNKFNKFPLSAIEMENCLALYLKDKSPEEKNSKESKKLFRRIQQIETLTEIMPHPDLGTGKALEYIKDNFTRERQTVLRDKGEEGYSFTKIWAAKDKLVNEINAILDRYQKEIYTPYVSPVKRYLP